MSLKDQLHDFIKTLHSSCKNSNCPVHNRNANLSIPNELPEKFDEVKETNNITFIVGKCVDMENADEIYEEDYENLLRYKNYAIILLICLYLHKPQKARRLVKRLLKLFDFIEDSEIRRGLISIRDNKLFLTDNIIIYSLYDISKEKRISPLLHYIDLPFALQTVVYDLCIYKKMSSDIYNIHIYSKEQIIISRNIKITTKYNRKTYEVTLKGKTIGYEYILYSRYATFEFESATDSTIVLVKKSVSQRHEPFVKALNNRNGDKLILHSV